MQLHDPKPIEMTERDFERVTARVAEMAGIELEAHKWQVTMSRLTCRLRARRFASFAAYLDLLDSGTDPAELQEFINTLTTNITSLFREKHHFTHLERSVLAPLAHQPDHPLRIWSAGCSSGEEAYSIGLSVYETLGGMPPQARILATDLDTRMLARARRGRVPSERCAKLPKRYLRHLTPSPDGTEMILPRPVFDAITFHCLNLLEPWPMKQQFDAIFCRNVMIYFGAATTAGLIDRLVGCLAPGGALYLGHSESILGGHRRLTSCGQTIYLRKD